MLTKKNRLPKDRIEKVKGGGRYSHNSFFSVVYLSDQQTASQFAFVLSKRISKKATVRNKTKRLIAGSVRELMANLKDGYWVVFLVKQTALDQDKGVLAEAVENSFKEIGLFKENENTSS